MAIIHQTHETFQSAPHTPGVYIFRIGKTPVYVGKAADIRKRLSSYFRKNVSAKTRQMVSEATSLDWIETPSEIEALIKEAEMIKAHLPKFNVLMRDDKSYFYVVITKDILPRIFVAHKTNLAGRRFRRVIGPFTSASALYATLKLLRKIFPYCTCKEIHKRPCLNAQIGRCLNFCCLRREASAKERASYRRNIKAITEILSGKKKRILAQWKRDMRTASKNQRYEIAGRLRDQIAGLENIFSHEQVLESSVRLRAGRNWTRIAEVIKSILAADKSISRVEGYDISNISGTEATGSMVVFINGRPEKSEYRKFKIKTVDQPNDVAMHREIMRRRLARTDWPRPDLLLIDGGKPQINAVQKELRPGNPDIRLAALAKREEELFIEGKEIPQRLDSLPPEVKLFFQHVRDESHRFAKKYHHKLRELAYREKYQNKNR